MNLSKALLSAVKDEAPKEAAVVDNSVRKNWNDYILWLEKKGVKGSPELDKGTNALQALEAYRKENPSTLLTKELIPVIQKDFSGYRQAVIDKMKAGKAEFAPGTNEQNFMSHLSVVDGIPGSRTTSFSYPAEYLQTLEKNAKNEVIKKTVENKGFVATN